MFAPQKAESLSRFSSIVDKAYDDFAGKCGGGDITASYGFESSSNDGRSSTRKPI